MLSRYKFILFVVLGALCLMLDAFYNGYPLVYSDTSTYLASGFELQTPVDRPITYGLFIRLTSLNGLTLWTVIFVQSLLLSYLVFLLIKHFSEEKPYLLKGLLIVLFLSLFTGISWSASQLIADIFTPIALLSLSLILFGDITKRTRILLSLLYLITVSMHVSHVMLFSLLLIISYLLKRLLVQKEQMKLLRLRIGLLLLLTVSAILTMGSAISKSKDVFMMGAMVEQGITKKYLDDNCAMKHYKICAYKDSLPKTLNAFVWDTNSVFYKTGGWSAENRSEYHDIIMSTFTQPKYIKLHIIASIKAAAQQLLSFGIGDGNGKFSNGTVLYGRIGKYVDRDLSDYAASKQNQSGFPAIAVWNKLYDITIAVSVICLLLILIAKRKRIPYQLNPILIILSVGIVLNAWDTATFSCVAERFGCKMMWLIPFMLVLTLYSLFFQSTREGTQKA